MAKKYSIEWKGSRISAIVIDGKRYNNLDQIPDEKDREKIVRLLAQTPKLGSDINSGVEKSPFRFMLPLFIGIAALMLLISILTGIQTAQNLAREVPVSARVVDLTVRTDENGNEFFYPVVAVVLPDGQSLTIQTSEGSWPPAYSVGDTVTLLFDPEKPASARIQSPGGNFMQWTWSIVTGFLAIAFFLGAVVVRWVTKNTMTSVDELE